MLKKNQPLQFYEGWYSKGGYPLYPDGITFKRTGPKLPKPALTQLYKGDGLPVVANDTQIIKEEPVTLESLEREFDCDEIDVPRYGSGLLPQAPTDIIYTGYDKRGFPIFPDGSSRPFSLIEIQHMAATAPRMSRPIPKRPDKNSRYKIKKRKNPPPRKVDIDQMFRDEKDRLDTMEEYK